MKKLPEVEQAKRLMKEAVDWSIFKWLWEKPKVRQAADNANALLDNLNRKVKKQWSPELQLAYRRLSVHPKNGNGKSADFPELPPDLLRRLQEMKVADEKARAAREDAEQTFDEAERQLSTTLAREGCKKAIHSWSLHEKAIRHADALVDPGREP